MKKDLIWMSIKKTIMSIWTIQFGLIQQQGGLLSRKFWIS
jgi:hypothetical protein